MTVPMYIKLRRDLQSKSREEEMDGVQPMLGSDSGELFRGDLVDALEAHAVFGVCKYLINNVFLVVANLN